MKKSLLILGAIVIAGGVLVFLFFRPEFNPSELKLDQQKNTDSSEILFDRQSSWGPCPDPDGGCFENITLYMSGRAVKESKDGIDEVFLSSDVIEIIKQEIINEGLDSKSCKSPQVLDLWITDKVSVNGKIKTVQFPGCQEEMQRIYTTVTAYGWPLE